MRSRRKYWMPVALVLVTLQATASDDVAECNAKFSKQIETLKAGFAVNQASFDAKVDGFLTDYAASHPAATKEDYRRVFDDVYRLRFQALVEQKQALLQVYESFLQDDPAARRWCKKSDKSLDAKSRDAVEEHGEILSDIAGQLREMLP